MKKKRKKKGEAVEKKQELQFISNGLSRLAASTGLVLRPLGAAGW